MKCRVSSEGRAGTEDSSLFYQLADSLFHGGRVYSGLNYTFMRPLDFGEVIIRLLHDPRNLPITISFALQSVAAKASNASIPPASGSSSEH
jgi:hypothetical protein